MAGDCSKIPPTPTGILHFFLDRFSVLFPYFVYLIPCDRLLFFYSIFTQAVRLQRKETLANNKNPPKA